MNSLFKRTNQLRMIDMIGHRGGFYIGHRWSLSWEFRRFVSEGSPLTGPSYSWSTGTARSGDHTGRNYISNETMEHYYFGGPHISGMLNQRKMYITMSQELENILGSLGEKAEIK